MTLINPNPIIGKQIFTAKPLPKVGDREDFILNVVGPDEKTNFNVPISITGTALSVWNNPSPISTAEALGAAVFHQIGTSTQPPKEGFWFDSYNSEENIQSTINKIYNQGVNIFIKNSSAALYVNSLGKKINEEIQLLDKEFTLKFKEPFFKSLEDISEESQRTNDLSEPAKDNANYLYKVCILSGIIDHINVKLTKKETTHFCSVCGQKHKQELKSLQAFKEWLTDKYNKEKAEKLITTLQMIKKLRKQYPIHDHYESINNIRQVRKEIEEANKYFGLKEKDYETNSVIITDRFKTNIVEIRKTLIG